MLKALLNKGGAGKSISREETSDRLSVLLRQYNEIMYSYDAAIKLTIDGEQSLRLEESNRGIRDDIAKLSELILSCGGSPPLGTDMEPGDAAVGADWTQALSHLMELEASFLERLKAEKKTPHMLRTAATIETTIAGTRSRQEILETLK
jgi:hypothetical protein